MYRLTEIKNNWLTDKNQIMSFLNNILENETYKIVLSVIQSPKNVYQIHGETNLPLSSIYKRVKKLEDLGIVTIDKININTRGRKTLYYKSKINSITFRFSKSEVNLLIT